MCFLHELLSCSTSIFLCLAFSPLFPMHLHYLSYIKRHARNSLWINQPHAPTASADWAILVCHQIRHVHQSVLEVCTSPLREHLTTQHGPQLVSPCPPYRHEDLGRYSITLRLRPRSEVEATLMSVMGLDNKDVKVRMLYTLRASLTFRSLLILRDFRRPRFEDKLSFT